MRTIAVALAVSLVTAGSSTAAFVVTSKHIKNGTIQLVDMSPRARAALRGQRGQSGPRGPAGFGIVQRYSSSVPLGQNISRSVSVSCPAGSTLIGGGFDASRDVTVYASKPLATGETWEVTGVYTGGNLLAGLSAHAICATASP
jgi:hypothetical protein